MGEGKYYVLICTIARAQDDLDSPYPMHLKRGWAKLRCAVLHCAHKASQVAQRVRSLPAMQETPETWVPSLGQWVRSLPAMQETQETWVPPKCLLKSLHDAYLSYLLDRRLLT